MRKLIILLLFIPFIISSQNEVTYLSSNKFNSYLDFVNYSINESSTNLTISKAKRALEGVDVGGSYSGDLVVFDDGANFLKRTDGTYLHIVKSSNITFYLGYNNLGSMSVHIFIYSMDKDFSKENNVVKILTRISFLRDYATDSKLDKIKQETFEAINKYFKNKCTTGIRDGERWLDVTKIGSTFPTVDKYTIWGSNVLLGFEAEKNCITGCESCWLDVEGGYTNRGNGINNSWSHVFYFEFGDKLKKGIVKSNKEFDDFIYNANFVIYSSGGRKLDEKLDLREINVYDLKAMVNFFIEDYNRRSEKVSAKLINPKIFKEEQVKATFEPLEGEAIALSYGMNDDSKIIIKIDPKKWAEASLEKKWYILYHELGHDVLNLEHGEGGKMMFNFADKEYSWDDFIEDKKYMLSKN